MNTRKRLSILLIAGLVVSNSGVSQTKPLIDTGMLGTWPSISSQKVLVSANGHYVAYVIFNQPIGKNTLVLQQLQGKLEKKEVVMTNWPEPLFFSVDSKQFCWQAGDSIFLQSVGDRQENRLLGLVGTVSYPANKKGSWIVTENRSGGMRLLHLPSGRKKIFTDARQADWSPASEYLILSAEQKQEVGEIRMITLSTGKEQVFTSVRSHVWSPDNKALVLVSEAGGGAAQIQWCSLASGDIKTIWTGQTGQQIGKLIFDKMGQQLAFNIREPNKEDVSIWRYASSHPKAELQVNTSTTKVPEGLAITEPRSFSDNGRWLVIGLRKSLPRPITDSGAANVDIWSYRDAVLFPGQSTRFPSHKDYAGVISCLDSKFRFLETDIEKMSGITENDLLLVNEGGTQPKVKLVALNGNQLKSENGKNYFKNSQYNLSPNGRWLWYWDPAEGHYYSVNPSTGQTINLTSGLPVSMANETFQSVGLGSVGMVGWYDDDSAMLVYDNYDIWRIDPSGKKGAVNLTGGYGYKHQIKLRLVYEAYREQNDLKSNEQLLLTGYNRKTGENGFFKLRLDRPGEPELLTMGPFIYFMVESQKEDGRTFDDGMPPVVGGSGEEQRWVVLRQSASEYPNLYVSRDFKKFIPLTRLQPQKEYNWLTAERFTWTMPNGMVNRGILYKPENFDSTKKYPVIFNYYQKLSHCVHQFPQPKLTSENINIPWFVSRGYLVCTPDIQYTVAASEGGYPVTEAAAMAVVSAARYLTQRSYIDSTRLGIQGHSFGAMQTNGIITQSNLFAAAAEMAGTSDYMSSYLTLVGEEGKESVHKQDHPQGRMGATPWERPDLYRRGSAVVNADKVTTPLFIVHNHKDESINFRQGVEMYMALRRLGKPCWLLQYDNGNHILGDKADALDYTIRLTQYFDHYLKGAAAPQWMTMNTLAAFKGKNNLYELDPHGNCMKDCKVCKKWNLNSTANK
ncbi:MAG: prolyl oligopeptidase family serine peptidase [Chitinophagaceae bacterium]|nr:prolyl oligopeptidase family serine peptidase [Chitinophagaceae bacterium]